MDSLLHQLVAHNLQKRTIALMENGTWAPVSAKHMGEVLTGLKNNTVLDAGLSIKSALKPGQEADLDALADALAAAVRQ